MARILLQATAGTIIFLAVILILLIGWTILALFFPQISIVPLFELFWGDFKPGPGFSIGGP